VQFDFVDMTQQKSSNIPEHNETIAANVIGSHGITSCKLSFNPPGTATRVVKGGVRKCTTYGTARHIFLDPFVLDTQERGDVRMCEQRGHFVVHSTLTLSNWKWNRQLCTHSFLIVSCRLLWPP
jgi:hypothetical protein